MKLLSYLDEYFFLGKYTINLKKIDEDKNHYKILKGNHIIKSGFVKNDIEFKEVLGEYLTEDFYRLLDIKNKLFLHKKYRLNLEDGQKASFKNYNFDNLDLASFDFTDCIFENCSFENTKTEFALSIPQGHVF